jgi:hypothetical protein
VLVEQTGEHHLARRQFGISGQQVVWFGRHEGHKITGGPVYAEMTDPFKTSISMTYMNVLT